MYKQLFLTLFLGMVFCLPLQAADDIYGPINRQDTLWNIAEKLRPSKNVTPQQVMMALYKKNPHAFTVNNISSLRKGAHLLAPTAAEVKLIKRKTAFTLVQRHNTRWKKRRFVKTNAPVPAELKKRLAVQEAGGTDETGNDTDTASTDAAMDSTVTESQQVADVGAAQAEDKTKSAEAAQVAAAAQAEEKSQLNQPKTADTVADASTGNASTNSAAATDTGTAQLSDQLTEVQQELAQTKAENQRLKAEMLALKQAQAQTVANSKTNEDIQVQLDALKHELTELRTILTEKNNHIKVLQASLKDASSAIKSQHADNMRLYNKLKELSPESVAVMAAANAGKQNTQSKPQLELAEVTKMPVAPNALTASSQQTDSDSSGIAKVWADEAPGAAANKPSAEIVNAVKSGESVTLGQILGSNQATMPTVEQEKTSGFSFTTSRPAAVSPIAWAAVLISFVFILFMIVRALLMQNELRRFEMDEAAS